MTKVLSVIPRHYLFQVKNSLLLVSLSILLSACVGKGPKTQYYGLFASSNPSIIASNTDTHKSIGIGPVILPDYLDNPAIVTRTSTQQIRVSGYNAWAGDITNQMIRVITDNLSNTLQNDAVWGFPWDTRSRPEYQVRIVVEEFSGILGQDITMRFKWSVLNTKTQELISVNRDELVVASVDSSYNSYVKALNTALNDWSQMLAKELSSSL